MASGWPRRPGAASGKVGWATLSQALAGEFDAVGIVDEAVEDRIGERRACDHVVPSIDRHLAGDEDRSGVDAVLDDFEEIAGLLGSERLGAPRVEDDQPR